MELADDFEELLAGFLPCGPCGKDSADAQVDRRSVLLGDQPIRSFLDAIVRKPIPFRAG